MHLRMFTLSKE